MEGKEELKESMYQGALHLAAELVQRMLCVGKYIFKEIVNVSELEF